MSKLKEVIELLHIELVVLPQFRGTLSRDGLYLLPLVLQRLELIEVLVRLLWSGGKLLDALQDFELALKVVLLLLLLGFLDSSTTFTNRLHCLTEKRFRRIYLWHELVFLAACLYESAESLLHLSIVELIEELLEQVELRLVAHFVALCNLLYTCHHLVFRLEGLLDDCLFSLRLRLGHLFYHCFCSDLWGLLCCNLRRLL